MIFSTCNLVILMAVGSICATAETDVLTSDLVDWLRKKGAYINPKVRVKHSVENDATSPLGLIAVGDMEEGEIICQVPPHLVIMPVEENVWEGDDCSAIEATYELLSEEELNPWARYLLNQAHRYTPEFWSDAGRSMLKKMTGDVLPPQYIDETIEELGTDCHGDINDELYLHAAMMVKSRADYNFLVPFYDMTNHNNGKLNMKHLYNPYRDNIKETGYAIATTQAVSAGDELFNSYNQCNICQDSYDWFGTPEMFKSYGFVEEYPQRWLFDLCRMKFDLINDTETGNEVVNFLVQPSKKGIDMLQLELGRLDQFSKQYRSKDNVDVPDNEWKLLWKYYDALHNAISRAVKTDVSLSEEVWKMPHDWWVKDGTMKERDLDDHYVRRSVS